MVYLENLVFIIPIFLVGVYGFAPFYILHYFKHPFNFLKYYITVFQIIILYLHLTAKDYLNDTLVSLYQAVIINPLRFWYVILYVSLNLILISLYLHPTGKQKKFADFSGYIATISMLLSWGIIFGWMGQDEIVDIIYMSMFVIRLMGPLSILLTQLAWTYIFGNHYSPYKTMIFSKLEKKHNLGELIPVYSTKGTVVTESKLSETGNIEEVETEITFFLEPEKRTTVIHTNKCHEFKLQTDNGEKLGEWIGPFVSYEEAFEKGSKIEGKSYPKTCGKCTPWNHAKKGNTSSTSLVVKESDVETTYSCVSAWLAGLGTQILNEEKPNIIDAVIKRQTSYGAEVYREEAKFNIEPHNEDTRIEITLNINPDQISIPLSLSQVNKRVKEVKNDLSEFLTESMKDHSKDTRYSVSDAFSNLRKPRPLLSKITEETPTNPNKRSVTITLLVVSATMLIIYGGHVFFFDVTIFIENALELLLTYGAAVAIIYWTYLSDRTEREPIVYLLIMFSWGVFSGLIAAELSSIIRVFIPVSGAIIAPFVEEPVKALGLYVFLTHPKTSQEFNSPLDGIIYGFTVGVGFYAMENFFYYLEYDVWTLLVRIFLCWGHGLWVAVVGLWIAVNRHYRGYNTPRDILPGLSVAVSFHLLWNSLSYFGEIGGQLIFYMALFQFGYLKRIINEGKRDEMFAGPDKIVFSRLDVNGANRASYSRLILILLVIAGFGTVMLYGVSYLKSTSTDWVTYELYGFQFDYPERLWSELRGANEGEEASETHGVIICGNYRGQKRELIEVEYGSYGAMPFWESGYDIHLYGENISLGEEVEFSVNGHRALYRRFNMTIDEQQFYCVTCGFACKDTWRCFYVRYHFSTDDYFDVWSRIVDSFICHKPD